MALSDATDDRPLPANDQHPHDDIDAPADDSSAVHFHAQCMHANTQQHPLTTQEQEPHHDTLDLKVLNGTATDCSTDSSDNDPIAACSYLRRLIPALCYFELLRVSKGVAKANALFGAFCREFYPMFLRDYIHFTRAHLNDAEAINACAHEKYSLSACAVSHCKVQRRESRRRGGHDCKGGKGSGTDN